MHVHVRAHALLRDRLGWDARIVEVEEGTTILDIYHRLVPPESDPGIPVLFAMGTEWVNPDTPVAEGLEIGFIPPMGGG